MPTIVIASTGTRATDSVTVNTVTSTTVTGYTNAWSVVLSATVPSTTKIGDKLTVGANSYLITNISGSTLTVVGDAGIAFTSTTAPATGAATTSRSYSSPNLWSAGAPASLVTKDWIWRGEIYKEGSGTNNEWVLGSTFVDVLIVFNATTDSTRYYVMTAATGQSFRDNANKLTNALRYNPANGVAIHLAGNFASLGGSGLVKFYNLQLSVKQAFSSWPNTSGNTPEFNSCVLYSPLGGVFIERAAVYNSSCQNIRLQNGGTYNFFIASTFIGNGTGSFGNTTGGNITIRNCAVFNYTSFGAGADAATSTYNATDLASFGWSATGNIVSKTFANQFENIGSGTEDFRVKAGADLINAGTPDATYTSNLDIVGTTRSLTTPTIGAWEYIYTYSRPSSDITTQWTPSTAGPHYALINETTYNDANYIAATAVSQTDEVGLQAMTAPQAGTNVLVNYRVQGITGGGSVTVSLYCGATLVKTDTTRIADNTSPPYYTMTVTPAEWASVTNWSDMRLRFVSA